MPRPAFIGAIDAGHAGPPPGVAYASLLHLDGADGSTTFTDSQGRTWARNGTHTKISTAQSKFGGASMKVGNGGETGGSTANGIKTNNTSDLVFGTGAWTIEWQQFWSSFADFQTVLDKGGTGSGALLLQTSSGSGQISVYVNGATVLAEPTAPATGVWLQYQLKYDGTVLTLTREGATPVTQTLSINLTNTAQFSWGAYADGTYATDSYLDECRITKGTALPYATQTAPWPD